MQIVAQYGSLIKSTSKNTLACTHMPSNCQHAHKTPDGLARNPPHHPPSDISPRCLRKGGISSKHVPWQPAKLFLNVLFLSCSCPPSCGPPVHTAFHGEGALGSFCLAHHRHTLFDLHSYCMICTSLVFFPHFLKLSTVLVKDK